MTKDEFRNARASLGLSRKELAELLGVAPGTCRNWEQGVRSIPKTAEILIDIIVSDNKFGDRV